MSTPAPEERRTWFPLILAGGFVAFALLIAFLAYAANRHGDPSQATSVDDVAELAIEAVDNADTDLAERLSCSSDVPTFWAEKAATATKSDVKGGATGTFTLTVAHDAYGFDVGQDGKRSCVAAIRMSGR